MHFCIRDGCSTVFIFDKILLPFLKAVPFIFGLSKSLAFGDLEAHGVPLGHAF